MQSILQEVAESQTLRASTVAVLLGLCLAGHSAPTNAQALHPCTSKFFLAPGVTITSATSTGHGPKACRVIGQVVTVGEGAPSGSAGFQLDLPARWNGKLLFDGGGGFNGYLPQPEQRYLYEGYATLGTDTGHHAGQEIFGGAWAQKPTGERDEAKVADYLYRAIPQVNQKVRPLISRYYGQQVTQAYFKGCSNGGREAMLQAQKNPGEFDGFIAGDASVVPALGMQEVWKVKVLQDHPISYSKLAGVDMAIRGQCDVTDGVKDGLIQNPAGCNWDPQDLVGTGVLTGSEAQGLTLYLSAIHDDSGELVEPGASLSGAAEIRHYPGLDGSISGLASYMNDPASPGSKPVIQKLAAQGLAGDFALNDAHLDLYGPAIFNKEGILRHDAVERAKRTWAPGIADPSKMGAFFDRDAKLLIYHGLSDADTSPYEIQRFYEILVTNRGGLSATKRNVRMFLLPEMDHCGGGKGPNVFDPVEAMDSWVVHKSAPETLLATKFADDDPKKAILRTMPVCAYPAMARYKGIGDRNQAKSWSCDAQDHTLATVGAAGRRAGLNDIPSP
jgi:feruloyl esterase